MSSDSPVAILYDADGNPVSIINDSGVRRLGTLGKLLNVSGSQVNPATEDTLATIDAVLDTIYTRQGDGNQKSEISKWIGSTAPSVGQKAMAASLPVALASDHSAIPVSTVPSGSTPGWCFGRVLAGAGAGTPYPMRATSYTEQTSNFQGSIKSSNANDTAAGTGARTVRITYFTQAGVGPLTEDVTLNGTAAVNLVQTNHCFIEKMEVLTAGSTGWNQGTITLYTGLAGAGTAVGSIGYGIVYASAGDNATQWAHHYVADGKTCSIYNLCGGTIGNQNGILVLRMFHPLEGNDAELQVAPALVVALSSPHATLAVVSPLQVAGFARLLIYAISNGTNTTFFGSFDYSEK